MATKILPWSRTLLHDSSGDVEPHKNYFLGLSNGLQQYHFAKGEYYSIVLCSANIIWYSNCHSLVSPQHSVVR